MRTQPLPPQDDAQGYSVCLYEQHLLLPENYKKLLHRDIHYIWLAGYEKPDFITINRFHNRVKKEINEVFTLTVLLLSSKSFISLNMEYIDGTKYVSENARYRAIRCEDCPLRCRCFKAKGNWTIELNHRLRKYKRKAKELLCSEEGLKHRGQRCIEPEAVFGQIKNNMNYKRIRHFGKDKVFMDFAFLAIAFNIKKMCAKLTKEGTSWLIGWFYKLITAVIRYREHINQRNPRIIAA